jgi:undecaprenyl phosphate-alpha-L-ara4N flippase subunit ArnF
MSLQRGLSFAMGSVVLVSSAQLGMRWSMARLPAPAQWLQAFGAGSLSYPDLAIVAAAILAYGLSMGCWLMALRDLPLGRAYSLLSVSYALVYLLAASITAFHEDFTVFKTLGVTLVILGVLTINSRRTPRIEP